VALWFYWGDCMPKMAKRRHDGLGSLDPERMEQKGQFIWAVLLAWRAFPLILTCAPELPRAHFSPLPRAFRLFAAVLVLG